jgi:hypothetical protein
MSTTSTKEGQRSTNRPIWTWTKLKSPNCCTNYRPIDPIHQKTSSSANFVDHKIIRFKKILALQQSHKEARLNFARHYMNMREEWQSVVFSVEKKINIDEPDGF